MVGDSTFLSPSGPRVPCKWYPMDTERIFPQIRSVQGKRGGPAKLYLPLLLIADQLSACSIATSQAHARRLKGLGLQLSRGGRGGGYPTRRRLGKIRSYHPTPHLYIMSYADSKSDIIVFSNNNLLPVIFLYHASTEQRQSIT